MKLQQKKDDKKQLTWKKYNKISYIYYPNKIENPVNTKRMAINHSRAFLIFVFFRKLLIPVPNIAQQEMQGKLTMEDKKTKKKIAITKFSSAGKNNDTAVMQITHAFGFTNWKNTAS